MRRIKVGVRKFTPKKRLQSKSPITQMKRKYSVKRITSPLESIEKSMYNKVYNKTTLDSVESLVWIIPLICFIIVGGFTVFIFTWLFG